MADVDQERRAALAMTMYERCQMTWAEIMAGGRHGSGIEKVPTYKLPASAKTFSRDIEFIAMRFHGLAPMVGYRSGRVFHVIWLDPKFNLYAH